MKDPKYIAQIKRKFVLNDNDVRALSEYAQGRFFGKGGAGKVA